MAVTPQSNTTLSGIAEILRTHDDYVICGHVSPDGDCIGSQLALYHTLKALGKNATCILVKDEPVPLSLQSMPGADQLVPACRFEGTASVFIGTDVPSRARIGEDACKILDACDTSITIDHHAIDSTMCDHVYVDPDAAAAAILVWKTCKLLMENPPIESATAAYYGLATDTGGFRYQNSDKEAFDTAAELVAYGVNPAEVAAHAFQTRTIASLRLESLAVSRMELIADDQVAISWVKREDFERFDAAKADAEPLINTLRSINGVRVACILREQDGLVRGSLRSKDDTDVSALACELGGGGHRAAAGVTLDMTMPEALELMKEKLLLLVQRDAG